MTRHPKAGQMVRVRVLTDGVFAGRLGMIAEWTKSKRVRVQLDNDAGYSWLFAKEELEVIE